MNEKEVLLPVVSHHCRTTHSACDCVLKRLKKLEAVAEAVRQVKDHPLIRSTLSDPSMGKATGSLWIDWKRAFAALAALAALEEKP